jgi:hypothetical protein
MGVLAFVIRHVELDRVKWIGESRRFEENRGFPKKKKKAQVTMKKELM